MWVNVSSHNGSGIAVCLYRNGAPLYNFDPSSDRNVYYTQPTPDITHPVYYDGTANDYSTLSLYQTHVGGSVEGNSKYLLPEFVSVTSPADLHLLIPSTINCSIFKNGDNNGIFLADDIDGDGREITPPYITDIGADEVFYTNSWTGASSVDPTRWDDKANWSLDPFPNSAGVSVYIPKITAANHQPIITSGDAWQVNDVKFETSLAATNLPLLTNNGLLKVAGAITGDAGSFSNENSGGFVLGSIEMTGGTCTIMPHQLGGLVFVDKKVYDLRIRNNVDISTATNDGVKVVGELNFGPLTGITLNTGPSYTDNSRNLTMVSTPDRTANIGQVVSNTITGDITVERYINTGQNPATSLPPVPAQHIKSWQFLATPTGSSSTGQTIYQSWQENGIVPTSPNKLGTWIVGPGTGFDAAIPTPSTASIQYYDPTAGTYATGDWVDITNTGQQVYDQRGYQVFIRGDRSAQSYLSTATPTIMRTKGPLYEPGGITPPSSTVTPTPLSAPSGYTRFTSVGNPYASAIDISSLISTGFSGVSSNIAVWDPLLYGALGLGGYQYLNAAAGYQPNPGGTDFYPSGVPVTEIQSGQAFFVSTPASATSNGTVSFFQSQKSGANKLVNRTTGMRENITFNASLYTNKGYTADGNMVIFDRQFENKVDAADALKLLNPGENFSLVRDQKYLAIEARQPVSENDTLHYDFSNLQPQKYQLRFVAKNMAVSGLEAYLVDKYLGTKKALSLKEENVIDFDATTQKASYKNRFIVIFNKAEDVIASSGENKNNKKDLGADGLLVSPNPVEGKTVNFRLITTCKNCNYTLRLVNQLGQSVYKGHFKLSNPGEIQSLKIDKIPVAGNYQLIVQSEEGKQWSQRVLIK